MFSIGNALALQSYSSERDACNIFDNKKGPSFRKITVEIVGMDNDIKQACNIQRDKGMSLESTYIRWEEEEDLVRKIKMWLER
jgi:hypothetical protein